MSPSKVHGALPPGTRMGRYQLDEALGDGASGVVYVAECVMPPVEAEGALPGPEVGTRVALKLIHSHLVKNRQVSKRFQREARVLRELRGEHVVSLLDYGELRDGRLFMALELAEGEPLDVVLQRGPLPFARALAILRQICAALATAHDAGVVHRDLKPGNVIVADADSDEPRVRVLDFGMAKLLRAEASQSMSALTEQNMVFGTPEYMAPEQARGDEVDTRCDIYAAGIVLYEMLTGSVPFRHASAVSIMTSHLTDAPEPPSSRAPRAGIPPAVEAVVMHALAKHAEERYPTAQELAKALALAEREPENVAGTIPPPSAEAISTSDTELSLPFAATQRVSTSVSIPSGPAKRSSSLWWWIALVAALIGIAAGVFVSVVTE
ncbi:MAG: serine/threonine-protein kinase [Polyangiaceae bacterium]